MPEVYIVFTYYIGMGGISKSVRGVYLTPEEAVSRQKELIHNGTVGTNGSIIGKDVKGVPMCAFVNVFPFGSCKVSLHSTSIPNWEQYM